MGSSAVTSEGQNIGTIEQVAIDLGRGCVAYAVLSVTGMMNWDTKLLAVPWGAFSFSPAERSFMLKIPRGKLENAPAFDRNNFPASPSLNWLEGINTYYGTRPYWED